jgi:hypothetical protein
MMVKTPKAKVGRPPGRTYEKTMMLRFDQAWIDAIDTWRNQQPDKPTKADAIRTLVERGMKYRGK